MSDHWRADVELVSLILDVKFEMRGIADVNRAGKRTVAGLHYETVGIRNAILQG